MVKVTVELSEDEYLEAKRTGKTHREIYAQGLGRDYTPKPIGRPAAFNPIAYEQKMMQIHLDKIRKYNEDHSDEYKQARVELGLDAKKGTTTPALGFKKKRG